MHTQHKQDHRGNISPAPTANRRAGVSPRAATALLLGLAIGLCLMTGAPLAQAQMDQIKPICGPEVKGALAKELAAIASLPSLAQLEFQAGLYEKYAYCAEDGAGLSEELERAASYCGAKVGYAGSLFYEDMSCCGYDPQRRSFTCPVRIKQSFGFGPAPNPGSRIHVLNCVADRSGVLQPVGHDSVHLADSRDHPTWQFGVVAQANENLALVQPMNGATRRARSIMSWGFVPTDCEYRPIWGNWLDYRIRLDQ